MGPALPSSLRALHRHTQKMCRRQAIIILIFIYYLTIIQVCALQGPTCSCLPEQWPSPLRLCCTFHVLSLFSSFLHLRSTLELFLTHPWKNLDECPIPPWKSECLTIRTHRGLGEERIRAKAAGSGELLLNGCRVSILQEERTSGDGWWWFPNSVSALKTTGLHV